MFGCTGFSRNQNAFKSWTTEIPCSMPPTPVRTIVGVRSVAATAAVITLAAISPFAVKPLPAAEEKDIDRLNDAATVFSEIMDAPDNGIPQDLLEKAHCIVIVPGLKKGAFIVGAKYG